MQNSVQITAYYYTQPSLSLFDLYLILIADIHTHTNKGNISAITNPSEWVVCTEYNRSAQELLHNRNMVKSNGSWVWHNPFHLQRTELAHIHSIAARVRRLQKPGSELLAPSNQPEKLPACHVSMNRTAAAITTSKVRNQGTFTTPSISPVERAALNPNLSGRQ